MLKELLTKERIQLVDKVKNYKEAIQLAADPIIKDGSITEKYVNEMIHSIEKNGPYIILADRFALPHARPEDGVNTLAMSMLKTKEYVDIKGKAVNIFIVLAATDNQLHIKALASLSEIMGDKKNIEKIILSSTKDEILELIKKYS